MEKEIEQKSCENCAFYLHYYIKIRLQHKKIDKGHCVKKNSKAKPRLCDQWKAAAEKRKEDEKSLKILLSKISNQLNAVLEYFSICD